MIVGEDLGTIPEGLRGRLAEVRVLSYRVLWFERDGPSFTMPEYYPVQALACLASHDLPTFSGWRAGRDIEISLELGQLSADEAVARKREREDEIGRLDAAAGVTDKSLETASAIVHGFVARAPSQVMLIQADDLGGEIEPLNVPGTDQERPNWRRRLRLDVEELASTPLAQAIITAVKRERPA